MYRLLYNCLALFSRKVLELQEAIKVKEAESDAYISEIEVPIYGFYMHNLHIILFNFVDSSSCIFLLLFTGHSPTPHTPFSVCLNQTIGQAYEDMQMQNQRLMKQVTERDDYNIKVCVKIPALTFISVFSPLGYHLNITSGSLV